jgi:hypothetical protein
MMAKISPSSPTYDLEGNIFKMLILLKLNWRKTFLFLGCFAFHKLQKVLHRFFLFRKDEREEKS